MSKNKVFNDIYETNCIYTNLAVVELFKVLRFNIELIEF